MISTTSTSPVYLHDQGYGVQTIGLAVSLHLGGMCVASPRSGWFCDRVGRLPMIGVGAMVLVGAVMLAGVGPGGDHRPGVLAAAVNRHGREFALVARRPPLTRALTAARRAREHGAAGPASGAPGGP